MFKKKGPTLGLNRRKRNLSRRLGNGSYIQKKEIQMFLRKGKEKGKIPSGESTNAFVGGKFGS